MAQPSTPQIIRSRRHQEPSNATLSPAAQAVELHELDAVNSRRTPQAPPNSSGISPSHSVSAQTSRGDSVGVAKDLATRGSNGITALSNLVYPTKTLGYFATSGLIVNRIIGSGIFDLSPVLLDLVGSKGVALCIWLLGCLISWAGVLLYIEYGVRFPLTGGELYYIDFLGLGPPLLITYMYAVMFVVIIGSQGNGLAFGSAVQVAVASNPLSVDGGLQKLLGIGIVGLVCLAQAKSRGFSVQLSNAIAVYKILLLTFISVLGFAALANARTESAQKSFTSQYGKENFANAFSGTSSNVYNYGLATLFILRAFHGYENSNLILEEIRRPLGDEFRVFRRSAKVSILVIGALYVLVNVALFAACSTEELRQTPDGTALFFQKIFGASHQARRASGIVRAISAFGCVIAHTYTLARVKQEIGRMGILPFPEFWAKSTQGGAPGPALLLHWIFTSILIAATPLNDANGYYVMSVLSTLTRTWVCVLLGTALLLAPRLKAFRQAGESWRAKSIPQLRPRAGTYIVLFLALLYTSANAFVFIFSWFPADLQKGYYSGKSLLPAYVSPTVGVSFSILGGLYWIWDRRLLPAVGYRLEVEAEQSDGNVVHMSFKRYISGPSLKIYSFFDSTMKKLNAVWRHRAEGDASVTAPLSRTYLTSSNARRLGT
ncbi:hypothetical protein CC78DRAFT_614924 [Lojkania enalia]|uniref:High-affinity methionine permease n=1 Tax=Lojkania enalia TaxID=147567 RepID=A0A9P4KF62_9PLEO|nr:hypothetical protein CC78DRAFT_614924 [Didymosphaeria enalia]